MLTNNQIKKINWYKQGGAGIPICISMPFFALIYRMRKVLNVYFPNDIAYIFNKKGNFYFNHYFDAELTFKQVKKIFKRIDTNVKFFKQREKEFHQAGRKMEKVGLLLLKEEISPRFVTHYKKFFKLCIDFWGNSLFPDLFDIYEQEIKKFIFGSRLKELTEEQIGLLLMSEKLSNVQKEQKEMLEIYKLAERKGIDEVVRNLIKKHSEKFYFIKNDYAHTIYLNENYYLKELKTLLNRKEIVQEVKDNLKKIEKMQTESKKLLKRLNFNKKIKNRLKFFNWVSFFRDERKKYNQISNYILIEIIKKISRKKKISPKILYTLIPDEVEYVLKDGIRKILPELRKRYNYGIFVFADKANEKIILSGKKAAKLGKLVDSTLVEKEIKGSVASQGVAKGMVKIILSQKDFNKMEEGDILVTFMTRPEYISLMKRAAAIITDEGGITSHAAIVSRELSIPCIIGTQIATKVLKDGDLVEVDAEKGVVKILKRSKEKSELLFRDKEYEIPELK